MRSAARTESSVGLLAATRDALAAGAVGVIYGRHIWQAADPSRTGEAIGALMHAPSDFGGQSMIVNPRGQIVAQQKGWTSGDSFVCTTIDIEALRRIRVANGLYNQFKDLRTEQYRAIYDKPIYPKNQYLENAPEEGWLAREDATRAKNIEKLIERGVITPPSTDGPNGHVISETAETTGAEA